MMIADASEPTPANQLKRAAPVPEVTAATPAAAGWAGSREDDAPAASTVVGDKDASPAVMAGANDEPAHRFDAGGASAEAGATALKPARVESWASSSPASSPRLPVGGRDPVEGKGPSVLGGRMNRGDLR